MVETFGGQPFTSREDGLMRLMVLAGWSATRIASALGRPSGAAVRHRYNKVYRDTPAAVHPQAKHRDCNRCGVRFWSQHFGVRRCVECREVSASVSPLAPDCGGTLPE